MATNQVTGADRLQASIATMEAAVRFEGRCVPKERYVKEFFLSVHAVAQTIETVATRENMGAMVTAGKAVGEAITKFDMNRKEQKIKIISGKQGCWQKFCHLCGRLLLGRTYVKEGSFVSKEDIADVKSAYEFTTSVSWRASLEPFPEGLLLLKAIVDVRIATAFRLHVPNGLPLLYGGKVDPYAFRATASGLEIGNLKGLSYEKAEKIYKAVQALDKLVGGPWESGKWRAERTGPCSYTLVNSGKEKSVSIREDGRFSVDGRRFDTLSDTGFSSQEQR